MSIDRGDESSKGTIKNNFNTNVMDKAKKGDPMTWRISGNKILSKKLSICNWTICNKNHSTAEVTQDNNV